MISQARSNHSCLHRRQRDCCPDCLEIRSSLTRPRYHAPVTKCCRVRPFQRVMRHWHALHPRVGLRCRGREKFCHNLNCHAHLAGGWQTPFQQQNNSISPKIHTRPATLVPRECTQERENETTSASPRLLLCLMRDSLRLR